MQDTGVTPFNAFNHEEKTTMPETTEGQTIDHSVSLTAAQVLQYFEDGDLPDNLANALQTATETLASEGGADEVTVLIRVVKG